MSFDFDAAIKDAERSGQLQSGDRFKIQEGANRIRVLTPPLPHRGEYKGTPNFKWLCYILDRADGQVKTYFMPHTIFKAIRDLQRSEDYEFGELPMPYDVTIQAKGAGTKDVEYNVVPARKSVPLTTIELDAFAAKKDIRDVQRAILDKQSQDQPNDSEGHFDPDEVPF